MPLYEDFTLRIGPLVGGEYPLEVVTSPAGSGRSSFRPAVPLGDLKAMQRSLLSGDRQEGVRTAALSDVAGSPEQLGEILFKALFHGTSLSLFDRSLGLALGQNRGLRLRLHIDPEDASLLGLASLAWEYLYRVETREFLSQSRYTPVVRCLDVQRDYRPGAMPPGLRVLVILSQPAGLPALDLPRERAMISAGWAEAGGVEVDFLEGPTRPALHEHLKKHTYHVLHYAGHGGFDRASGMGGLWLSDAAGQASLLSGSQLRVLLHDAPRVRLVFLNGCETAMMSEETGRDPFAGVAAALVMAGVPAVLAMQFAISDRAALAFSKTLYARLARGCPIDEATAEGRQAVMMEDPDTIEWGAPVLHLRAPDGILWRRADQEPETMSKGEQAQHARTVPWAAGGDVIIADVGDGASNVAVGKNITQAGYFSSSSNNVPEELLVARAFERVARVLADARSTLDSTTLTMAQFQLRLLEGELAKTAPEEAPSASTITQVGDWLLEHVPPLWDALADLFSQPWAVQVMAKAGPSAVDWWTSRFKQRRQDAHGR